MVYEKRSGLRVEAFVLHVHEERDVAPKTLKRAAGEVNDARNFSRPGGFGKVDDAGKPEVHG